MKRKKTGKILNTYAIFDPAIEGGYNVSFPSFPGCVTFGETFDKAKSMAAEALSLWIEELQSQKLPILPSGMRPIIDEISFAV